MHRRTASSVVLVAVLAGTLAALVLPGRPARADEGLWPFNMAPVDAIAKTHGVTLSPLVLERAMKASVRFTNGGSGSFVARDGLVMTNHHVVEECLGQLSQAPGSPNLVEDGFIARGRTEEVACPGLELNVLQTIEDVSARIEAASRDAPSDAEKNVARKAEMARVEGACAEATGLRCDVVTLFGGGAFHLYSYKRYTDVRLAFAPELGVSFFGGDTENFSYPRNNLDVTFVRVYEGNKPVQATYFLPFSARGPVEGGLVFASGHPGSTDRFSVVAKHEVLRDVVYPLLLERLAALRDDVIAYGAKGDAEARAIHDERFYVENSLKAISGFQAGLLDKALMAELKRRQDELVVKVNALPNKAERDRLVEAWPRLEKAWRDYRGFAKAFLALERGVGGDSTMRRLAVTLVRLSDELAKPSDTRLREYRDSNLPSVELRVLSPAPIDAGLEQVKLAYVLENLQLLVGRKDPAVKAALAGKAPEARAAELIAASRLADVEVRRALLERIKKGEGRAALDELADPLVEMVRALDKPARDARKRYEDELEAVERTYAARVAEAAVKVHGAGVYPDATFTLRLSSGLVKGYVDNGARVPWATGFGDLYRKHKRHGGKAPYALPQRWLDEMGSVDFTMPFNFVSTVDGTGGSSGSPLWNERGQVVGLVFDGNTESLSRSFLYTEEKARSIAAASNGILHALDRVYGARHLVDELVPAAGTGPGE